jgi:hypothetical protein
MWLTRAAAVAILAAASLCAQSARDIVRKSVELDQSDWLRMKNYTWTAREVDHDLDGKGAIKDTRSKTWETLILFGRPYRRLLKRDGKSLSPGEQAKEQRRLDKATAKLEHETPEERQKRIAEYDKERAKERAFLLEIPDAYDFRREPDRDVDGHDVWVIAATPKPDYKPKSGDAKALLKIQGTIWIDKAEYQWVRLDARTIGTISWGWFLARLDPGARLEFEQTRINNEIWLPKREFVSGAGRLGLLKKVAMDQEITWSNYHKFEVTSHILPAVK